MVVRRKTKNPSIVSITEQPLGFLLAAYQPKVLLKQITAPHMTAGMKIHP